MSKQHTGRWRDKLNGGPTAPFDALTQTRGLSLLAHLPPSEDYPADSLPTLIHRLDQLLKCSVLTLHARFHVAEMLPPLGTLSEAACALLGDELEAGIFTCSFWPCTDFVTVKDAAKRARALEVD